MSAETDFSDYVVAWLSGVGAYTMSATRSKTLWPPLSFPHTEVDGPPTGDARIYVSNAKLGAALIEDLSNDTERVVSVDPDKDALGISAGYEVEANDGRIKILGGETADVILRLNLTLAVRTYDEGGMDNDPSDDFQFTNPMRLPKIGVVSDRFLSDMGTVWSDLNERILSHTVRLEQRVTPTDGVMAYNLIMDFQLRR